MASTLLIGEVAGQNIAVLPAPSRVIYFVILCNLQKTNFFKASYATAYTATHINPKSCQKVASQNGDTLAFACYFLRMNCGMVLNCLVGMLILSTFFVLTKICGQPFFLCCLVL